MVDNFASDLEKFKEKITRFNPIVLFSIFAVIFLLLLGIAGVWRLKKSKRKNFIQRILQRGKSKITSKIDNKHELQLYQQQVMAKEYISEINKNV